MSAIGSLLFCTDCGNLLQNSSADPTNFLFCDVCGARNKDAAPATIISESKPSAFPSSLRAKRSAVQTLTAEDRKTEAIAQHTCAKCGRKEMYFSAVQLRSADEGSTIFYRCVCGYK
ncbi:putative DNA-directed RNA polymerase I 13.1 kDa polypeptide [Aspergillus taichungensis]|uniref:DNA-directed RNA polymerase subunit n=1 Tax=Aspergillus taichungensis TaxID=482145 RepID=A0A2J5HQL7_9EURO|nr:putative DNA-directed RNA polymerase I 13.1 kDa polypeptide [Aspergillus taichungensis]